MAQTRALSFMAARYCAGGVRLPTTPVEFSTRPSNSVGSSLPSTPGVTLYHWSYRRKKSNVSWKERAAQKEEALPKEEAEQRGEVAEQALRTAYEGGELPSGFQGQVYLPVACH